MRLSLFSHCLVFVSLGLFSGCGDGVLTPNSSLWSASAYLKASNAESNDFFGYSVAVSGDTMVVGTYAEDSAQTIITNGPTASADNSATWAGAVYVFRRYDSGWIQEAYLKAPNAETSDNFGISVAISGDTIVVGASGEDSNQANVTNGNTASSDNSAAGAGAAYVFRRVGTSWAQEAYLKPTNTDVGDSFGVRVAISGDTVVVGAHSEDSNQASVSNGTAASADNSAPSAGAAYVFRRAGIIWSQEAYLKAANAEANDNFGHNLAISGDTVVVGARFEDSNQTSVTNGAGSSMDNSANGSGAAYVFQRAGVTWSEEAYLKASNSDSGDNFGISVGIDGNTVVVGANLEDSGQPFILSGTNASADNSANSAGAAYVFRRSGTSWSQEAFLKASNTDAGDNFGSSASISGNTIIVGANSEDAIQTAIVNGKNASADNSAVNSGAAYVFERTGSIWDQAAYLKPPNSESNDNFAFSVAIESNLVVVGSNLEDSSQSTITNGDTASAENMASASGAAYVFLRKFVYASVNVALPVGEMP